VSASAQDRHVKAARDATRLRLHAGKRRAVLIGDTPYDAQAARKAGIHSVGVLTGYFAEPVLRQAGCEAVFRDAPGLASALQHAPLQPARRA
jgi:phosphoglycolate phosphatase-like HAD superfamily hydrolase